MEKNEIKNLAMNIMFDVNDEECADIAKEFITLEKMLDLFDSIDTSNVEEMVYPFEAPTNFFREDVESNTISQDDALKNVAKTKQGHIVVPKVVK